MQRTVQKPSFPIPSRDMLLHYLDDPLTILNDYEIVPPFWLAFGLFNDRLMELEWGHPELPRQGEDYKLQIPMHNIADTKAELQCMANNEILMLIRLERKHIKVLNT